MKGSLLTAQIYEPYAQALMAIAQSNDLVDRFGEDVAFLLNLLDQSDDLRQFLGNPVANAAAKTSVIQQVVGEQVHSYMMNFLLLIAERGRISFLDGICQQYQVLLRQLRKTVLAEVTSAIELNDDQRQSISQKVLQMTGAEQVELEVSIDPDLIGGVIIKVGSQIVDSSLRGQLRRISLRLNSSVG